MKKKLFKSSIASLIAGMLIFSSLPIFATSSEGMWKTISRVDMTGFTWEADPSNEGTELGGAGVKATKTQDDRIITVGVDGRHTAPWGVHPETRFFNTLTSGVYKYKPVGVGGTVLVMPRKYSRVGGWVNSSSAFTVDNIFDKSMVKVGDKLRITAWVYTADIYKKGENDGDEATPVSDQASATSRARMWITDDEKYSVGAPSESQTDEAVKVPDLPNQKWVEISLTYTIDNDNKDINRIRIDSDYVQEGEMYPVTFILGAVTTEIYKEDIKGDVITEKLADENMDGFTKNGDAINGFVYTKTKTTGGQMQIDVNGKGETPSHISDSIEFENATHNIMTSRPKNWGSKALVMYRNYSNGFPSSASGFKVKNLLDTQKLQIGDIVTVKAWIWTQDMVIVDPGKTLNGIDPFVPINGLPDGADREAKSTSFVRMWLSKEDAYNASNPSVIKYDEGVTTTIGFKTWKEVSFRYTVDAENKNIGDIRIDSGRTVWGDTYPRTFILGALEAEVARRKNTYTIDEAGKLTGTVTASVENAPEDAKVIVAAYDHGSLVGCDIKDYNNSGSFDFEIEGATGVNEVNAFVWSMNNLAPCTESPIALSLK